MISQLSDSRITLEALLRRAEVFSKDLPQSQGARKEGKTIILTFIVDKKLPFDTESYRKENIDECAIQAYHKIFSDQDEVDLLLMDIRLVFSVLFWDGQELSEMKFTYRTNDLLFLAANGYN
jgi:hypothetical protein